MNITDKPTTIEGWLELLRGTNILACDKKRLVCGEYDTCVTCRRYIADAIASELAERYMELPTDDDGEVWHIGDKAQSKLFPRTPAATVCGTGVIGGKPVLFYLSSDNLHASELHKGWDYAESMRHYRHDTWRRIIDDAMGDRTQDPSELVARCKALAGEDK